MSKPTPLDQRRTTLMQIVKRIAEGKPVWESEVESAMNEIQRAVRDEVQAQVKAARKEFEGQMWGSDDDKAVDAFIKILQQHFAKTPIC